MKKWIYLASIGAFAITIFSLALAIESYLIDTWVISALIILSAVCISGVVWSSANQVEEYDSLVKKQVELRSQNDYQNGLIQSIKVSLSKLVHYMSKTRHSYAWWDASSIHAKHEGMVDDSIEPGVNIVLEIVEKLVPQHDLLPDCAWLFVQDIYELNGTLDVLQTTRRALETIAAQSEDPDTHVVVDRPTRNEILDQISRLGNLEESTRFLIKKKITRLFWFAEDGLFNPVDVARLRDEGTWTSVHDKALKHYLKSREIYHAIMDNEKLTAWHKFIHEFKNPRPDGEGDEDTTFPAEA